MFYTFSMISLLWIFQTVFLNDFYQLLQKENVKKISQEVENVMNSDNLSVLLNSFGNNNDACIKIVYDNGASIYNDNNSCAVNLLDDRQIMTYFNKAIYQGGSIFEITNEYININNPLNLQNMTKFETGNQDIIYAKITYSNERPIMILVSTRITPVDSTISTLKTQLILMGTIFILFAFILAYVLNRKIARPLHKMTSSAKEFASGNYDVEFVQHEFDEISKLSDTLNYATEKVKESDKIKKDLIANVSHDLRTPLTMINGYAQMMIDIDSEKSDENIQVIVDESLRLNNLVNDLLDMNNLQDNSFILNNQVFSLNDCISDLLSRYKILNSINNFEFVYNFDSDIYVDADIKRIQQVLSNLLNNAIHYSNDSRKIIVNQIVIGDKVKIEVCDFGVGISTDKIDKVWDRYYKVDSVHTRALQGSGIGLNIVKEILELYKSSYGVTSQVNVKTVFYFDLFIKEKKANKVV